MGRSPARSIARAVAVLALGLAGCGGSGTLEGRVSYRGRPVVYGVVSVVGADGLTRVGNISPDGSYAVRDVPAGPATIGVDSPQPPDPVRAGRRGGRTGAAPAPPPPVDRSQWVRLPDHFADPSKSGVSTTVRSGANPFDIALP
jgi:hypothetical protein